MGKKEKAVHATPIEIFSAGYAAAIKLNIHVPVVDALDVQTAFDEWHERQAEKP